uniref:Major sperm protein n=1 Tax=Steinernema glaseri TaxID=37863 RepID=A0A1I7Z2T8_9BILA
MEKTPVEVIQSQKESSDWELSEKKLKASGKDQGLQASSRLVSDGVYLLIAAMGVVPSTEPSPSKCAPKNRLQSVADIKVRVKPNLVWVLDDKEITSTHRIFNGEDFAVVFRVLTTSPDIFRVSPVQAIVEGKTFVDIKIVRKAAPIKSSRFDIQILHYDDTQLPRKDGRLALGENHRINWFFRSSSTYSVVNIRYRQRPPWYNVCTDMPSDFAISQELSAVCAQLIPNWRSNGRITVEALVILLDAMEASDGQ